MKGGFKFHVHIVNDDAVAKDLQWRSPVETFSQSGIEPMAEGVQLALGVTRQGGPLGQALVRSPLCASIVGQCVTQQGGHVPELVREPVAGTLLASVPNEWPWASPRLRVSRSSTLMCV